VLSAVTLHLEANMIRMGFNEHALQLTALN
jgi:hypothetical protein